MRHKWLFISILCLLLLGFAFIAGMVSFVFSGDHDVFSHWGSDRIGVVTVDGPIFTSDDIIKDLEDARKDDAIASVVLRINSPGGSVGASQEILEAVRKLAKKKPVVASMADIAASGGYYIACGATKILANPGTVTGSIGVRMEHVMLGDLLKWAKIGHETLKSGKFKDIGTFDRPMTEEERKLLEGLLVELHDQFKKDVAEARRLDPKDVDLLADGRVYSGQQAKALGLVDEIGGLTEAVKTAADLAGIKGEPKLSYPEERGPLIKRLFEGAKSLSKAMSSVELDYWRPVMALSNEFTTER